VYGRQSVLRVQSGMSLPTIVPLYLYGDGLVRNALVVGERIAHDLEHLECIVDDLDCREDCCLSVSPLFQQLRGELGRLTTIGRACFLEGSINSSEQLRNFPPLYSSFAIFQFEHDLHDVFRWLRLKVENQCKNSHTGSPVKLFIVLVAVRNLIWNLRTFKAKFPESLEDGRPGCRSVSRASHLL
jgi:hypothetical protein